jgi:hypothetical protein
MKEDIFHSVDPLILRESSTTNPAETPAFVHSPPSPHQSILKELTPVTSGGSSNKKRMRSNENMPYRSSDNPFNND